jgi:hypothetical protein
MREAGQRRAPRRWRIVLYMASDNGLRAGFNRSDPEYQALRSLRELEKLGGASKDLAVVEGHPAASSTCGATTRNSEGSPVRSKEPAASGQIAVG